jgi:hypothetical protein
MKKRNGQLGPRLVGLIAERRKLKVKWEANRKECAAIQCRLDQLTTALAKAVGLEACLIGNRQEIRDGQRGGRSTDVFQLGDWGPFVSLHSPSPAALNTVGRRRLWPGMETSARFNSEFAP